MEHKSAPGTVLVTGGASGLGAAVVDAVENAGGTPIVLDIAEPRQDVAWERVDLADTRAAEATVRRIAERLEGVEGVPQGTLTDVGGPPGPLAAVVTVAGIDVCGDLLDIPAEAWERVIAVNLLGTAAVVRAALPFLGRRQGRVVTVASTLGLRALPAATAYCASKFGVVGFTRALATELAGRVGVTLLIPGGMQTAFFDGRPARFKPAPDAQLNCPRDVAEAVLFALRQPWGCEVRELVITPSTETSWP
jgi:NAD(P)-dependent dehydrogenase (short-subunit alcohol dehydrogenase family)